MSEEERSMGGKGIFFSKNTFAPTVLTIYVIKYTLGWSGIFFQSL